MSHESPTPAAGGRSTLVLVAVIGLLGLVLLLIAGLVWDGRDPSQVIYFASGPVALGIITGVLGQRLDAIKATAATNAAKLDGVGTAVNGQLTAQFDAVHKRLDYLGAPPAGALGPSVPPRRSAVPPTSAGPGVPPVKL